MSNYIFLASCSFALSFLLIPLVRNLFIRWYLFDYPDNGQKLHARPVPRVGGIAVAAAYLLTICAAMLPPHHGPVSGHALEWKILPAAGLIFVTGLIDDVFGLDPWQKLAGQLLAAVCAVWSGIRIQSIHHPADQAWWLAPVTVIWLVACCNAFNLIDGVDGLAAGIGLLTALTIGFGGLLTHNNALVEATLPLAGALAGILRYNFTPASIFLGDCGSLSIGFLLGCYAIVWSRGSASVPGMAAPLVALTIPLLEVGLSICRRFLRGQPILGGDRRHMHHRLLAQGLTPRAVVLALCGACCIADAGALILSRVRFETGIAVIAALSLLVWTGIARLQYAEFEAFGFLVSGGVFRRLLATQIELRSFDRELSAARGAEECWRVIRNAAKQFGFTYIDLNFAGSRYEERFTSAPPGEVWDLNFSLSASDYVHLQGEIRSSVTPSVVTPFVELLDRRLRSNWLEEPAPLMDSFDRHLSRQLEPP